MKDHHEEEGQQSEQGTGVLKSQGVKDRQRRVRALAVMTVDDSLFLLPF